MERFEYEITRHGGEIFKTMVYLCTPEGACNVGEAPMKDAEALLDVLNQRGWEGRELTQIVQAEDAVLAFWKRRIAS